MEIFIFAVVMLGMLLLIGFVKLIRWISKPSYVHRIGNNIYISTHKEVSEKERAELERKYNASRKRGK